MRAVFLLLAPALLAACAAPAAPHGIEGPVMLGQTAYVDGPHVRPDRLIEDSRCPVDVVCVTAGRLVLRATVFTGKGSRQIDLTLGEPVPVADGTLTLVAADPPPTAERPRPQPLRFAFAFEGGL